MLFGDGSCVALKPAMAAVGGPVAVSKADGVDRGIGQRRRFGVRALAVVGMHELHERPRRQLRLAVTQNALPRRIEALEAVVEGRCAEQVKRQVVVVVDLRLQHASLINEAPEQPTDEKVRDGTGGDPERAHFAGALRGLCSKRDGARRP